MARFLTSVPLSSRPGGTFKGITSIQKLSGSPSGFRATLINIAIELELRFQWVCTKTILWSAAILYSWYYTTPCYVRHTF